MALSTSWSEGLPGVLTSCRVVATGGRWRERTGPLASVRSVNEDAISHPKRRAVTTARGSR